MTLQPTCIFNWFDWTLNLTFWKTLFRCIFHLLLSLFCHFTKTYSSLLCAFTPKTVSLQIRNSRTAFISLTEVIGWSTHFPKIPKGPKQYSNHNNDTLFQFELISVQCTIFTLSKTSFYFTVCCSESCSSIDNFCFRTNSFFPSSSGQMSSTPQTAGGDVHPFYVPHSETGLGPGFTLYRFHGLLFTLNEKKKVFLSHCEQFSPEDIVTVWSLELKGYGPE